MDPKALAQQFRSALTAQGYTVGGDGSVRDKSGAALPPWVWAQGVPELQAQKVTVQGQQLSPFTLPPGYQESAWHGMHTEQGPFSFPDAWDQTKASYESKPDWMTRIGTAAVGGLFAAPAVASAVGGGGGAATFAAGDAGDAAAEAALAGESAGAGSGAAAGAESALSATAAGFEPVAGETAASAAPSASNGFMGGVKTALGMGGSKGNAPSLLERYAVPAISGVFNSLAANKRSQDALQLQESTLDPYRGQMHQAADVGRLDQMATGNFKASPTSITGRYAHSYEPDSPWLPSDTARGVAAAAEDQVARGQGAELGQPLPRVNYSGGSMAAMLAALKKKNAAPAPGDPNSPWLSGAA